MICLKISRSQLLYDIGNYAYIEGHRLEMEPAPPQKAHLLSDACAPGNIDRVDRVLSFAHACAIEMLFPLTRIPAVDEEVDNEPFTPDDYLIWLKPSARLSRTTVHLLSRLVHEYMVCKAVHDWMSIVCPDAAAKWAVKAAEAAADICSTAQGGIAPLIRPLSPF